MAIHYGLEEVLSYKEGWNELARSKTDSILNRGVCTSFEWYQTIEQVFIDQQESVLLLNSTPGKLNAALPLFKTRSFGFLWSLHQYNHLYSTRSGLLSDGDNSEHLIKLFKYLICEYTEWSQVELTVLSGSADEKMLHSVIDSYGLKYRNFCLITSPYMKLDCPPEDIVAALDKKFRYNINSRLKKLLVVDEVKLRVFREADESLEFLQIVLDIERKSWKEKAGTSITKNAFQEKFYGIFTPIAAKKGWLRGFVLYVGDSPVAYSYGILFNSVLESLKSSFDENFKKYNVGNIIKLKIVEYLCAEDVLYYDFIGEVEPAKGRWASETYSQTNYVIYNNSSLGRVAQARDKVKEYIKKIRKNYA